MCPPGARVGVRCFLVCPVSLSNSCQNKVFLYACRLSCLTCSLLDLVRRSLVALRRMHPLRFSRARRSCVVSLPWTKPAAPRKCGALYAWPLVKSWVQFLKETVCHVKSPLSCFSFLIRQVDQCLLLLSTQAHTVRWRSPSRAQVTFTHGQGKSSWAT